MYLSGTLHTGIMGRRKFIFFFFPANFEKQTKAVVRMYTVKQVLLKISKSLRENTCVGISFWIKLRPVNFAKFLRSPFLQNAFVGCF